MEDFDAKEAADHCLKPVARFGDIRPGEFFRFPGTKVVMVKRATGYQQRFGKGLFKEGVFKTGAKTAVIPLSAWNNFRDLEL